MEEKNEKSEDQKVDFVADPAAAAAAASAVVAEVEKEEKKEKKEAENWETEMRDYPPGEMLPDGRICAVFVTGLASSPMWQFDLVFKDLVKSVPTMAVKYVDFGKERFNPEEVIDKIVEEIGKREYRRYVVAGLGLGGQLAYRALLKLDEEMAGRTTGVLFSVPAGDGDIRSTNKLIKWVVKKPELAKFLDRFRSMYWKLFGEKRDVSGKGDAVREAYARKQAYESQFPVTTFFVQANYFYGFAATKVVKSRLVVVDAVEDTVIRDSGGWDKLSEEVEHRRMAGGHADSVVQYGEFARIVADEASREEQIMKRVMSAYEGKVY